MSTTYFSATGIVTKGKEEQVFDSVWHAANGLTKPEFEVWMERERLQEEVLCDEDLLIEVYTHTGVSAMLTEMKNMLFCLRFLFALPSAQEEAELAAIANEFQMALEQVTKEDAEELGADLPESDECDRFIVLSRPIDDWADGQLLGYLDDFFSRMVDTGLGENNPVVGPGRRLCAFR